MIIESVLVALLFSAGIVALIVAVRHWMSPASRRQRAFMRDMQNPKLFMFSANDVRYMTTNPDVFEVKERLNANSVLVYRMSPTTFFHVTLGITSFEQRVVRTVDLSEVYQQFYDKLQLTENKIAPISTLFAQYYGQPVTKVTDGNTQANFA